MFVKKNHNGMKRSETDVNVWRIYHQINPHSICSVKPYSDWMRQRESYGWLVGCV